MSKNMFSGSGSAENQNIGHERRVVFGRGKKGKVSKEKKKGSGGFSSSVSGKGEGHGSHLSMSGPASFVALAPRDTICAAVNIIGISPNFRKYMDHPPYKFCTRLDLCRDTDVSYRICIIPGGSGEVTTFKSLSELIKVQPKKRNCFQADFTRNFFIHVQFLHPVQYQYFLKMLQEIVKINEETKKAGESGEKRGEYKRKQICTYKVAKPKSFFKSAKKMSESVIHSVTVGPVNSGDEFYEIAAENWMPPHILNWVNHIYVQPDGSNAVVTLYEYMETLEPEVYRLLEKYFTHGNLSTYSTLMREIKQYEKDPNLCHKHLQTVLGDRLIRRTLFQECAELKRNGGLFNINFFLVLQKRVNNLRKYIESRQYALKDIMNDLKGGKRYWWSVEDCRDYILSLLLYRMEFEKFLAEKEQIFFKMEQDVFENKIGDVDWSDDQRCVVIDPDEWQKLLDQFNEDVGFKMENLSFRVKIAQEQNQLRTERKQKLEAQEEGTGKIDDLQRELDIVTSRINSKNQQYETFNNKLLDLYEDDSDEGIKKIEKMEERCTNIEILIGDLTNQKNELEAKIRKFSSQKKSETKANPEILELEEKIIDHIPSMLMGRKSRFMISERRRIAIREHLLDELDHLSSKGMSEFPVKLVISILKEHTPSKSHMRVFKYIDRFFVPKFIQWGFIHASCQISSVGFHWFSNNLVMMSDLAVGKNYVELVAIDCCCPLIVNYHTAIDRLNRLAEEVISANINCKYALANVIGKEGQMNCQEFVDSLIRSLDYTQFFPVVENYLSSLRKDLNRLERQKEKNLRYLITSDSFKKTYCEVWKSGGKNLKKFKPDRKNRIFFNTHKELDMFYNQCLRVEDSMDFKFPGEYQLLKGFDRAFWMRAKEDKSQLTPDCPFIELHQQEKEESPLPEEIIKKEEEEDEGEEED